MKKIALALALVAMTGSAYAANSLNAGAMGLTIALTDTGATPSTTNTAPGNFIIGGKYFMAKDMALTAGLGLSIRGGDDKGTDIGFTVGMRKYLKTDDFAPFIGGRFGYASGGDSGLGSKYSMIGIGAEAGAEYFFNKQFSMEGTVGFGYKSTETTSAANVTTKATRIGTESIGIAANFYF